MGSEMCIRDRSQTEEKGLRLDMNAIAQIIGETREVSRLLQEAMGDAEPPSQSTTAKRVDTSAQVDSVSTDDVVEDEIETPLCQFNGLPMRYHGFLEKVLEQSTWNANQLELLARENGQMLSGVVEAINEWSYEKFEDWLIEEGPEYHIHNEILKKP